MFLLPSDKLEGSFKDRLSLENPHIHTKIMEYNHFNKSIFENESATNIA